MMAEKKTAKKPAATNPNPDWQDNDIKLKPIVGSLVLIAVVCVGTAFAMSALFDSYRAESDARDAKIPAIATVRELPPAPILQVDERKDLEVYTAEQAALLDHYAHTDKMRGIGRIPISRAMQLLAVDAPEQPVVVEAEAAPAPKAGGHH